MPQRGVLFTYLAGDHRSLEDLLDRAVKEGQLADPEAYGAFRRGLLRHIAIEEKLLIPAAHAHRGGEPLPIAAKLRLDHGAIAALLVPVPTPSVVAALHAILADHNLLEEGPGGLYDLCEGCWAATPHRWSRKCGRGPSRRSILSPMIRW
jgi:hypothetical protein